MPKERYLVDIFNAIIMAIGVPIPSLAQDG